ncbi:MAG: GNAT family N-acetyltransferase, partial [Methylacidiphilales bacterium]|nr:GNAT family N-acetyltransferase [Candidatus Methylacidiphilales bacterium]
LKSAQYKATQKEDIFAPHLPFTAIMRQLHATRTPTFQGVLSTLYIHDRLIAAHFGMIYHHTYHIWFPTYDPEFEKYSPGLILLHQILLAFPSQRLTILDFGKGHDSYKLRFMNDAVPLAHGYIEPTTPRKIRRRFSQVTRRILSPLKPYLQPLLNRNRPKK